MAVSRAAIVDQNFLARVAQIVPGTRRTDLDSPVRPGSLLTARRAIQIFESQMQSRHLDFAARDMRARDEGFYTIGSSGHEGNAAVAAALRHTDMAFLHYRSGAFFIERSKQIPGQDPLKKILLGVAAAREEPISGGRHKVFGSVDLFVPPQTSTIASQLPKAVGAAITLDRMRRLKLGGAVPADSIIVCSFGDASLNHSTAAGAINAACWAAFRLIPVPIVFVCEDNGVGISVSTPRGWVTASMAPRAGVKYIHGDGLDIVDAYRAANSAVTFVRQTRRPAFLHLETVRLLGHAGSDVEQLYRTKEQIEEAEAKDPLLRTAETLIAGGWLSPAEVAARYESIRGIVAETAIYAGSRPRLSSATEIIAPLAPRDDAAIGAEVARPVDAISREKFWDGKLPEADKPRHLAVMINRALGDLLVKHPETMVFGEDVSSKGGVYHVTADLRRRAGVARVFDTLLDEQSVLGMAIGASHLGCLPIPEIQYLAYLHNAIDQIRGEAASMQFFSNGQFKNPMVVRIASYAYQKGFGGHFHNDNSVAALRDIPGVVIASPSRGDDAVRMLRTCVAAAKINGLVCAFLEPIALYMTKDLHDAGDELWLNAYPEPGPDGGYIPIGTGRTYAPAVVAGDASGPTSGDDIGDEAGDLTIISFANGLYMSLRAARRLARQHGIRARVLDLRWLNPLPVADILREANATGRVLVVDETRRTGGVSEAVFTALIDNGFTGQLARVCSADTYIPLGPAADLVLVSEAEIEAAAIRSLEKSRTAAR